LRKLYRSAAVPIADEVGENSVKAPFRLRRLGGDRHRNRALIRCHEIGVEACLTSAPLGLFEVIE
jgi:hypothetical protein